jgi:membrane protease subunit HflC
MQTERQQRAAKFRAEGSQQSQQIKAEADRKVTVTIAQAQQEADQIKGEGEAERNRIFAESYGKDPDFFAFYRSMQAYETALKGESRIVMSPKSDFFRYFSTPKPPESAPNAEVAPEPRRSSDVYVIRVQLRPLPLCRHDCWAGMASPRSKETSF